MKIILEEDGKLFVDGVEYVKKEIETKEVYMGIDVEYIEEFAIDIYNGNTISSFTPRFRHAISNLIVLGLQKAREQKENLK